MPRKNKQITIFQLAINDAYEFLGKYFHPEGPLNYSEHQLFMNPYVHVYMIYKFAREFLRKKEYITPTKNKILRYNLNFIRSEENKDAIINELKSDLLYLYKFNDNIFLDDYKEISKMYDSKWLSDIAISINKFFDSDFELEDLNWVIDDEHPFKNEFIERTNRFYSNLTHFQMELPKHILKLIELLLSKDYPEIKVIHNLPEDVEINLEYIMKCVKDYFGQTLNIYYTMKSSDVYYDVPVMDFVEDFKIYNFKLD